MEGGKYIEDTLSATVVEGFADLTGNGNMPLVVINACQVGRQGYSLTGNGGFAQAFLRAGAGAFIGTLWAIGDSPRGRHGNLLLGAARPCDNRPSGDPSAPAAAESAKDSTWLAYVVYGHPYAKLVR